MGGVREEIYRGGEVQGAWVHGVQDGEAQGSVQDMRGVAGQRGRSLAEANRNRNLRCTICRCEAAPVAPTHTPLYYLYGIQA